MDGQLKLTPFAGDVFDAETPTWAAIPARPIPESLTRVCVVDGKPRMEARLLLEDEHGGFSVAGYGAYVVGAVDLCPHGSRAAELLNVRARRVFAYAGDARVEPTRLSPRNPHTGQLEYTPAPFEGAHVEGARAQVQRLMLEQEQTFAQDLAAEVQFDETDEAAPLTALILQDGPVRVGQAGRAVVGCVKTLHTDYLGADRMGLLTSLKPGERTPVMRFEYGGGRQARFTWFVRLCDAPFYLHPLAGVMRLEMHAPHDEDFVPVNVQRIADLSGTLLCRLAGHAHKDPRAPQNLIPTGALEQAMGRAMGDATLITRRIRAHIAQELGVAVGLSA